MLPGLSAARKAIRAYGEKSLRAMEIALKRRPLKAALVAMLSLSLQSAASGQMKASALGEECRAIAQLERANMTNPNLGQLFVQQGACVGYIKGWMEATDGSVLTEKGATGNDDGVLYTWLIQRSKLPSNISYIGKALVERIEAHPLDGDKTAGEVLAGVLAKDGLLLLVHRASLACSPTGLPNP
jgi:hypothetical protein